MLKFFEKHVDPHKDKNEDEFGGIEKLFEKQNQIGSVGDQLRPRHFWVKVVRD